MDLHMKVCLKREKGAEIMMAEKALTAEKITELAKKDFRRNGA